MQEKRSHNISDKLLERIISVAYGESGWLEKIIINRKAKRNPEVYQLLEEYKLTADSVHRIKQSEVPESVMDLVHSKTNLKSENNFLSSVYIRFFSKPILSTAVAGLMIIAVAAVLLINQPQQPKYTQAQIELAQKQFKESLAIVGKVFSSTEKKLDEDILNNQINKSLGKGFNLINDILIGG